MSNHFHLVVETPRVNLIVGTKWLLGNYTMRFNQSQRLAVTGLPANARLLRASFRNK